MLGAYGQGSPVPTVGEEIDGALADEDTQYCFAVVASKDRAVACYLLSKERPIPVDALRHIDSLRGMLERSILHNTDVTGATPQ